MNAASMVNQEKHTKLETWISSRLGSIRNKLLASFLGISLLIMVIYGAVANYVTRTQTLADVGQIQQNTADSQARNFGDYLSRESDMLLTLSYQLQDAVMAQNFSYLGDDQAAIQNKINTNDQEWVAADKAGDDNDHLVASRLNNPTAQKLRTYRQNFAENVEVFLTDRYGGNVAVSNRTSDYNQADEAWWQAAYNKGLGQVYIGELQYDESVKSYSSIIAVPIYRPDTNEVIGILRTTVSAKSMFDMFAVTAQTSQIESVDVLLPSGKMLSKGELKDTPVYEQAVLRSGIRPYKEFSYEGTQSFVSVAKVSSDKEYIKDLGWLVVVHKHSSDALAAVNTQFWIIMGVGVLIMGLAAAFSFIFSRTLSRPLVNLTHTANRIAEGDLAVEAQISSNDEIGQLAQTFNSMTAQLRGLIGSLEQRVAARTKDLATVAEVGTAATAILDVDRLLQQVVELTKERFNLYHSHIYLMDETGENLVLAAGAGEPGRQMKARGFSIPLSREQSLVARAARERKGVTVNDVTLAPDFLPNPLLPDTHSELAVPMMVGEQVVGVFDVQSELIGRFTESDISVQTVLASQIAIAIQNARSYGQTQDEAEMETLANTIGQKIQLSGSVDETMKIAIRELGQALGATRVSASLNAGRPNGNGSRG